MVDYWDIAVDNILERAKKMKDPENIPLEQHGDGKFLGFIYQGCAALKYENSPEELRSLPQEELAKRLYYFSKSEKVGTSGKLGRITLKYHREARESGILAEYLNSVNKRKTGDTEFKFDVLQELLRVSAGNVQNHLVFEGIHFNISLTGEITFL